jgi:hypothetical protein
LTVISPTLFRSKYVFRSFAMSFFVIMWNDGLVVKTSKCGRRGCGFKFYFEHSSWKRNLKFRYSMVYMMLVNDLVIMSTWIYFFQCWIPSQWWQRFGFSYSSKTKFHNAIINPYK